MPKLTDSQAILLSSAAQRADASLLPLPAGMKPNGSSKTIDALLKRGLAEERETTDREAAHRSENNRHIGVYLTAAGGAAIGVAMPCVEGACERPKHPACDTGVPAKPVRKTEIVLDLLRRPAGATLSELTEATEWLPHSTRAAFTGLRKKGYDVVRGKRDDVTCYRVSIAK